MKKRILIGLCLLCCLFVCVGHEYDNMTTEDLTRAIEKEPENIEFYHLRSLDYFSQGKYSEGLLDIDAAIKIDPEHFVNYLSRGLGYLFMREYEKALSDFDLSIKLAPSYSKGYYGKGRTLNELQRPKEAVEVLNKAIELDNRNVDSYYERGKAFLAIAGNLAEAYRDFRTALQIDPYHIKSLLAKASMELVFLFSPEDALKDINKVLEINRNEPEAYYLRAQAYEFTGQAEKALKDIQHCIELAPNFAAAYSTRGFIYYKKRNYKEALADLNKAIQLNPKPIEQYNIRKDIYLALAKQTLNAGQKAEYEQKAREDELKVKELGGTIMDNLKSMKELESRTDKK